jgi:hypothetical protein
MYSTIKNTLLLVQTIRKCGNPENNKLDNTGTLCRHVESVGSIVRHILHWNLVSFDASVAWSP